MNANELASYLEHNNPWKDNYFDDAATMLRQQQAEIDKWKFDAQTSNEAIVLLNERIASYLKSSLDDATMLRQQQAEIEALKKQIPDWENINKPNPFIGWEKNLVAVDPNPNSGLGGVALRKAQEKC
jgi:hypothetical protein